MQGHTNPKQKEDKEHVKKRNNRKKKKSNKIIGNILNVKSKLWTKQKTRHIEEKNIEAVQKQSSIVLPKEKEKDRSKQQSKDKQVNNNDKDLNKARDNSQGSLNACILTPLTTDTTCLLQLGGNIEIDFGGYQLENCHGPDIDNNSEYESGEDINTDFREEENSTEEVAESSLEDTDEENDEISNNLVEAFATAPKEPISPVFKKTEDVIEK